MENVLQYDSFTLTRGIWSPEAPISGWNELFRADRGSGKVVVSAGLQLAIEVCGVSLYAEAAEMVESGELSLDVESVAHTHPYRSSTDSARLLAVAFWETHEDLVEAERVAGLTLAPRGLLAGYYALWHVREGVSTAQSLRLQLSRKALETLGQIISRDPDGTRIVIRGLRVVSPAVCGSAVPKRGSER